jgi:Tfp pilus assembly protein PilV
MTPTHRSSRVPAALRARLAPTRAARGEAGFTVIEALGAIVLFVVVATALAGILVSAINTNGRARERTQAQQVAQAQIETIRRMPYDKVGTVNGNPAGTLQASQSVTVGSSKYTVNIAVKYVGDSVPTSYPTGADYKRVTVTVLRPSDSKLLAKEVTYVSSPARAPLGGLNNAIINVQVVDYALNTPVEGVNVNVTSTSPSVNLNDTADDTGNVSFPALTPNPSSSYFYDITASLTGYVTLKDDLPPAAATHHSLAPSETFNTKIRIYKPATINVALKNADGSAFTGDATVTVSSSRGSEDFSYAGSPLAITTVKGEPVVPSIQYTVSASTSGGLVATPVTKYVPDDYPNVLSTTFTLTFPAPSALVVTVTQGGVGVQGATVTVTDGASVNVTGTTDASFNATFSAINPGDYTVMASVNGMTASASATTTAGNTTYVTIDLPVPGQLTATVTWGGYVAPGATVTLTGGPDNINISGTTDASGVVVFSYVPPGSGYTVTASKSGASVSQLASVVSSTNTNVALALPGVGAAQVTVKWPDSGDPNRPASGAQIALSGGPDGISNTQTANSSGVYTFTNVPAGATAYTITATKSGQTVSTSATVSNGSTTNVTLSLPTATMTVRVRTGNSGSFTTCSGSTVTVVGGPNAIAAPGLSGTTSGSPASVSFTVPLGGAASYTVTATDGALGPVSQTVTVTGNTTVTIYVSGTRQTC